MIRLYCILFVAYLCSATNGVSLSTFPFENAIFLSQFDSNTFGGASALPSFQDYFNIHGGSKQGLVAASYVIGNMVNRLCPSNTF
jgi:hypothetical protein